MDIIQESKEPLHRYEYKSVLDCAQSLHEHVSGASDPLPQKETARLYVFLNMRLATWQPSPAGCQQYDDAVRKLIETALFEFDDSHWRKYESVCGIFVGIPKAPFICECGFEVFRSFETLKDGISGYMCNRCGREYSSTAG